MQWEFHYCTEPDHLEVAISGDISPGELDRMAIERWQELRNHDYGKRLFDFPELQALSRPSTFTAARNNRKRSVSGGATMPRRRSLKSVLTILNSWKPSI